MQAPEEEVRIENSNREVVGHWSVVVGQKDLDPRFSFPGADISASRRYPKGTICLWVEGNVRMEFVFANEQRLHFRLSLQSYLPVLNFNRVLNFFAPILLADL